jgi:hypothetical protein
LGSIGVPDTRVESSSMRVTCEAAASASATALSSPYVNVAARFPGASSWSCGACGWSAAAASTTAGSSSNSTSIFSAASCAAACDVATTSAISSPT